MTDESSQCDAHHWILGDFVDGPKDVNPSRGRLRYRESTCKRCGESRVLRERETNYISLLEIEL